MTTPAKPAKATRNAGSPPVIPPGDAATEARIARMPGALRARLVMDALGLESTDSTARPPATGKSRNHDGFQADRRVLDVLLRQLAREIVERPAPKLAPHRHRDDPRARAEGQEKTTPAQPSTDPQPAPPAAGTPTAEAPVVPAPPPDAKAIASEHPRVAALLLAGLPTAETASLLGALAGSRARRLALALVEIESAPDSVPAKTRALVAGVAMGSASARRGDVDFPRVL